MHRYSVFVITEFSHYEISFSYQVNVFLSATIELIERF